ncbi:MAG TPA: amidase [Terriglobales bacterium]|nr:amidase [Terriglobales bacterium]
MTLKEASEAIRSRRISPVELTHACLSRVEREDKHINSFITVLHEEALAEARKAEEQVASGDWRGPLHGIPISIKDLINLEGKLTTAGSRVFLDRIAIEDADVVCRLKSAGAVIVGKNNLHEFAYGGSGVVSHFGPVRNPRDRARITGGSSSGSAAAVAAGFCFASIGTDTAGSIRLPAACCGVVGLKPAFGRLSLEGIVPLAWSYDHVGPIARTVEDAEIVFKALGGTVSAERRPLRIGIARKYFFENADAAVVTAIENVVEAIAKHVASVVEITVPVDEDRTVSGAESWQFHEKYVRECPSLYDPRTLTRIRSGEHYSPEAIEEKRRELERIRRSVPDLFRNVDVIITPTSPILPPTFTEIEANPDSLRPKELLMLRNTRVWNVYGVPAISVPCGEMIGIQIAGLDESTVLAAAKLVERLQ